MKSKIIFVSKSLIGLDVTDPISIYETIVLFTNLIGNVTWSISTKPRIDLKACTEMWWKF